MKTLKSIFTLILAAAMLSACEKKEFTEPTAIAGLQAGQNSPVLAEKELDFNPQPEPPAQVLKFEILGRPGGDFTGRFQNGDFNGRIAVKTLSSKMRGKTMHWVQSWTLYPESVHPPEPVIPPTPMEPVSIRFKGIYNVANGTLVLNGKKAHVKGKLISEKGGILSFGGELMFNPQPEPPAVD